MTRVAVGSGLAAHHFHGNYWASFALAFDTEEEAAAACRVLGAPWEVRPRRDGRATGVRCQASDLDGGVERIVAQLVSFGAERGAILSLAKSVDYGEPFTVTIPLEESK